MAQARWGPNHQAQDATAALVARNSTARAFAFIRQPFRKDPLRAEGEQVLVNRFPMDGQREVRAI